MARRDKDPFVKLPVWWAAATKSPDIIVAVELLRRQFETHGNTFSLPNGRLLRAGVSREVKRRVLRNFERAGLISVERPSKKSPVVTLILL